METKYFNKDGREIALCSELHYDGEKLVMSSIDFTAAQVESIAFGYFCTQLETEAKRIAENGDYKRILQIMWDKTKPQEKIAALELANRIAKFAGKEVELVRHTDGNYYEVGSFVLDQRYSVAVRNAYSNKLAKRNGFCAAVEGSASGLENPISEESIGNAISKVPQGLFEDYIYESIKSDIDRQRQYLNLYCSAPGHDIKITF